MATTTTTTPVSTATSSAPTVPITATAGSSHGKKTDLQASYQALIVGLQGLYQPDDMFHMKSGTYGRDALVGQFQTFVGLTEKTKQAHLAWRDAVQAERDFELQVRPLRQGVRGIVTVRFGKDGTKLMQFGFTQGKQSKKTAATKAEAVTKTKATRVARGIKGKKQRKAIKAPLPAAPSSGQTAPAASAPAAAPSANR
ncbi:MAG TPA: hypothetical protein VGY54_19725 [Polyangiaceae bacterium]|jgi:hypothetical protein|nr:hypothetical protein [Polyangiaceae bacterium]